jgi:hypothetical protein
LLIPEEDLANLVTAVEQFIRNAAEGEADVRPSASAVVREARGAPPDQITVGLVQLAASLESLPPKHVGLASILCGALAEHGADPEVAIDPMLRALERACESGRPFLEACLAARPRPPVRQLSDEEYSDVGLPRDVLEKTAARMPAEAAAYASVDDLCRAAIALLSRLSSDRRRLAKQRPGLGSAVSVYADRHAFAGWLGVLLDVPDDQRFLVIDLETRRGFLVEVGGVSDNFQLHILLANALVGSKGLPGVPPTAEVVSASDGSGPQKTEASYRGLWDLIEWRAVRPDRTVEAKDHQHWIWGEGRVTDIPEFEGVRVVLLSPTSYERIIAAQRQFSGLRAKVQLVNELTSQEVESWMERFAKAPRAN